jgi:hypothetical protein
MVKDEHARNLEEGALEVPRRKSISERKTNCWMASLLNSMAKQKLAWIQALIPIDL